MYYALVEYGGDGIDSIIGVSQTKENLQKLADAYENTFDDVEILEFDDFNKVKLPEKGWLYRVAISHKLNNFSTTLIDDEEEIQYPIEQVVLHDVGWVVPWYSVYIFGSNAKEAEEKGLAKVQEYISAK